MKYSGKSRLRQWVVLMVVTAFMSHNLYGQKNFVYTNDRVPQNAVSGFSVDSNGALTAVPGSPFATGGKDNGGFFFGSSNIAIVGHFLFAANGVSKDVSVFTINSNTGELTLVPGSPFAIQTHNPGLPVSMALSPTPDGQFLMASSSFDVTITVFRIAPNGALTQIPGSPFFASTPDGIKVSPDGKFLAVGNLDGVEMFSIASDGSVHSLGEFPGSNQGEPAGVDIDCSSSLLYAGESTGLPTIVDAFHIDANGQLMPVAGSPFQPGVGGNSSFVLLSADDKTLFVSNQNTNSITAFRVASDGSLSLVPGAPFHMNGNIATADGMSTSQDGSFLYVASTGKVSVFRVEANGALTEVAGSPFLTEGLPGVPSPAAFPPKTCSLTVEIEIKPPASAPVPINPGAKGKISAAILSTPSFNAVTQVDRQSLTFGHSGSEASLAMCDPGGQDVNNDGLPDLLCHFNTQQTGLVAGDNTAVLEGKTVDGKTIHGSEAIRTVPPVNAHMELVLRRE